MKNKDILNALGGIDPEFIADAEKFNAEKYNGENTAASVKKTPRIEWKKWTLAAACVCLAVITVFTVLPRLNSVTPPTPGGDVTPGESTPSGSENISTTPKDDNANFVTLGSVVFNGGSMSFDEEGKMPEEDVTMGELHIWNGLFVEEKLYNKLDNAETYDYFVIKVDYVGEKLYSGVNNQYSGQLNAAKNYYKQLKDEVSKLEMFRAEIEQKLSFNPPEEQLKIFYDKCVKKYNVVFTNSYFADRIYNKEELEKDLSRLYDISIPNQLKKIDDLQSKADQEVRWSIDRMFHRGMIITSYIFDDSNVIVASKDELKRFARRLAEDDHWYSSLDLVLSLAPASLSKKAMAQVNDEYGIIEVMPEPGPIDVNVFAPKFRFDMSLGGKTLKDSDEILKAFYDLKDSMSEDHRIEFTVFIAADSYANLEPTKEYIKELVAEMQKTAAFSNAANHVFPTAVSFTIRAGDLNDEAIRLLKEFSHIQRVMGIWAAEVPIAVEW